MILGLSIRNLPGYCPASKHGKKCVYSEDPKYFFNLLVPNLDEKVSMLETLLKE